jgi:hypothetical protein
MHETLDLVAEIFQDMSTWGTAPGEGFEERILAKYPRESALEVEGALSTATELQALVLKSGSFYNEPYPTIHEKVRRHLREEMPGLTERAYLSAERRIMFMYIK